MGSFNLTTAVELTRRLYPEGLEKFLYEASPAWGLLKKWTGFGGEGKFLVWQFAPGAGGSFGFSTAQANKSASQFKRPFITRVSDYALASIDAELWEATMGDKVAQAEAYDVALADALYNYTHSQCTQLYGAGGGARGQFASGSVAGMTLTLSNPQMAIGFHVGMWVQTASTNGLTGSVNSGRVQLAGVNRTTGVLTSGSGNWSTAIPAIVNTDFVFREGDFGGGMKGFGAWNPTTAPTGGDSFFGIDRSADPDWLAGQRYAPTSGNYKEILVNACAIAQQVGQGKISHFFMNPIDWGNLENEVGSQNIIQVPTDKPTIGYEGLRIATGNGSVKVLADPFCPRFRAHGVQLDTWEIWSLKEAPRILDLDGMDVLREANADAYELRVGGRLQLTCKAPKKNIVVTLPAG